MFVVCRLCCQRDFKLVFNSLSALLLKLAFKYLRNGWFSTSYFHHLAGHLWLGCPCSSWVWLSRHSTKRNRLRPRGRKTLKSVKMANRLVRRVCYLFLGFHREFLHVCVCWIYQVVVVSCSARLCSYQLRLEYAHRKKISWTIEQPANSLLPYYRPLED